MENLDLLYSLFNQYVFQDAKNNIGSLEYYFNTNPSTSGNPLVEHLLGAIQNYDFDSIDVPLFQSIIQRDRQRTPEEQREILNQIMSWKNYSRQQMAPTKAYLRDICASTLLTKAMNRGQASAYEVYQYLKNSELKLDNSDLLSSTEFNKIDLGSILEKEKASGGFKSYFQWVNDLFYPAHMYENGQMVLVTMPPGTGKTLWMMTEALNMALTTKAKIHYLAMGDMKLKDFIVRMGAIYTGRPFGEVTRNIVPVYNTLRQFIGDRLDISVIPAGQITSDEYVDYVRSKDYDVVFIDYDSNFKLKESDSMYNDFGVIYNSLTKLSQDGRLVFIAAQPKIITWANSTIELGDVGESARKIHTIDILFTAGKFDSPNHLGIFKCCKNRRGEEGGKIGYIRLGNGRFKFIPVEIAKQLSQETQKKNYTEADIDMILRQYENVLASQGVNTQPAVAQSTGATKVVNPFKSRP